MEEKLTFKTADELSTFLMDLQGQVANIQETIDKLAPVEDPSNNDNDSDNDDNYDDEEVNEIDQLLQGE